MLPIHTILHPTDFSPRAEAAFRVASALARDYKACLVIAHVQQIQTPVVGEFGVMPVELEDTSDFLDGKLAELKAGLPCPVETYLLQGDPVHEITALSNKIGADIIVLGTHGRTGLGHFLMGSVAERVVRRAPCLVLTVKMPLPETETLTAEAEATEREDLLHTEPATL